MQRGDTVQVNYRNYVYGKGTIMGLNTDYVMVKINKRIRTFMMARKFTTSRIVLFEKYK
jgi:hypothetical protein